MNSKRFFYVMLGVLVVLGLLTIGGAYQSREVLNNKGDELVSKKLEKTVLDLQQTDLNNAKKDLVTLNELSDLTKSIIPRDKDQARTIVEINNLAEDADIKLASISFPTSSLGGSGKKKTDPALSQLTPVEDLKGVYVLPVTVTVGTDFPVAYSQIIEFLEGLENNRRTAQVTSVSIIPDADNPSLLTFTIVLNAYIKPEN